MFTVESLFIMFPDFILLTPGTNISKPISTVTVLDDPAVHEWMRGDELLITSGYIFSQQPGAFYLMLEKLVEKKVSALAIKVSRFMGRLPEGVLQCAIDLDFTIIEIPPKYAFSDIINPVLAELVDQRMGELQINEDISRRFLQIGVADVSYQKILTLLRRYINSQVFYYSFSDNILYASNKASTIPSIEELKTDEYCVFEVSYQKIHYGDLYIQGLCESFHAKSAVRHAILMFRLSIQTILSNRRYEEQRRNDFLSDLIFNHFNSRSEIVFKAQEFGWKLDRQVFCAVIQIIQNQSAVENASLRDDENYESLRTYVKSQFRDCYYVYFSNYIVLLFAGNNSTDKHEVLEKTLSNINKMYSEAKIEFAIGKGRTYPEITKAGQSFTEAKMAATIGSQLFDHNRCFDYDEIAFYDNLLEIGNKLKTLPMVQKMASIELMDRQKNTCYFLTLTSLINCDWNMQQASKELSVHYNTMKYRVGMIREITGWKLEDREEKYQIETALKVMKLTMESQRT